MKALRPLWLAPLFCSTLLAASRTFVSADVGSDTNPCTRTAPCRSFAVALAVTDTDGEAIALDSGGYGPVTVTQAVSIIAPPGIHAGITATTGNGVTVTAPNAASVLLRGLFLSSQGATAGISGTAMATLYIEDCEVDGFSSSGITFAPATAARLYVLQCVVRGSDVGVRISGSGVHALLDDVQALEPNFAGFSVSTADATFRNCIAAGGVTSGFAASLGARVAIDRSVSKSFAFGFNAQDASSMVLTRCISSLQTVDGVIAGVAGTTIYVAHSTITGNATGVAVNSTATVHSLGNNTLQANTTNGAFTAVDPAH